MNYLLFGLVAVVLLAGLVAIGVGNRGWSWGTVTAAILTLVMAAGYLVVASRMAAYEWSWAEFVRGKQAQLAEARDGLVPEKPGGRLVPAADKKPLDGLAIERDRWQRAFDRIDSWRSRHWTGCTFRPPVLGAQPADGVVEIRLARPSAPPAADGDAADPGAAPPPAEAPPADAQKPGADAGPGAGPPFDPGVIVYLFDERAVDQGGRYLGALRVLAVTMDPARTSCTLTVAPAEPPDAYDQQAWSRAYDACVTVFDDLPGDRWLAFSKTPQDDGGGGVMPTPTRRSIDDVESMIGAAEGREALAAEVERHESESIDDPEEWPQLRARLDAGELLPGQYWATVRLDKDVTAFGEKLSDEDARRELLAGTEAEFDLQTAFTLQDDGFGTIQKVRFRRPLRDAGTRLYGGLVGGSPQDGDADGIPADGIAALAASTRSEIARLQASIAALQAAQASVREEAAATATRKEATVADLRNWARDAAEAERLATAFVAELDEASARLDGVSREVIRQARDLRTAIAALSARIDAVAPAPARPAAVATP